MWQAIEQAEPRTRQRFPNETPRSVRCDPHAYRRLLQADLRKARRNALMRKGRVFSTLIDGIPIFGPITGRARRTRTSAAADP
jgi:hypothetical protein